MAGQKVFLYYLAFLIVSSTLVIGSDENGNQDLGKLISSLSSGSKKSYTWSSENEVSDESVDSNFQKPVLRYTQFDINPAAGNNVDSQNSTESSVIESGAGTETKISPVTNNIRIDKVIITSPCSQFYNIASKPEPVKSTKQDEFHDLLENWRALLVSDEIDETNSAARKYINKLSDEAESLYKNLDKSRYRVYLWPKEQGDTLSADITTHFQKLRTLTLAYGTRGTNYYKDSKILSAVENGLDFMVKSGMYDGDKYHGNWWDWQVGVPKNFIDIIMILSEELPTEYIQKYTNIISSYVPNTYNLWYASSQGSYVDVATSNFHNASGTQKAELARTVLGLGILQKNKTKISLALETSQELFKVVSRGNGFYQDGSFIFHHDIPYTGLFGNVLVERLGEIVVITKDSTLEMARDTVESFAESVERAFLPLIHQGETIAPVNGLSISRSPLTTSYRYGPETMYNLLSVAKFAAFKNEKKLKESVKYWIRQNPDYYFSKARNYNDLLMTMNLLNDSDIAGDKLPFVGTKMYHAMDRFVQQTPNYMLGLSLYSKRISAFEAGNKENKHGWHTADGAIYLYNYDDVQFGSTYWPTVDPYRLPGTTVDTIYLNDEVSDYAYFTSNERWVGGVAKFNQAVVGMALNKAGFQNNYRVLSMDLKGKKSWFVVEGQVVALGAGITGTTAATIETIVDNRLLNDLHNYKVLSDHGEITGVTETIDVNWLLLESDNQNASIGYYFPNCETVNVIQETRSGSYVDINESDKSNYQFYCSYRKFIIDHGRSPVDASYAYVLLPGMKQSEIMEYVENKPVNILENSAEIQAVEITNEGYLGINVWSEAGGMIAGISSNKPVSLMRQTDSHQQTYVLSDPTQSDNVITIKIPVFSRLATMSEGIYYDVKDNAFVVDFTNARGASKQFTVYNVRHDDDHIMPSDTFGQ